MGAWGVGNWENDDARDWALDLANSNAVEDALVAVSSAEGRQRTGTCCRALAAAEVVAAWSGRPGAGLPEEVSFWIETNHDTFDNGLIVAALAAVAAVESDSELRNLFDEDGPDVDWHEVLADLRARLEAGT
jgi:hypothetical protein